MAFGYVGWVGRGNLGDDAIARAFERALTPGRLINTPWRTRDRLRELLPPRRRRWATAFPLLGGGTLVGGSGWRSQVSLALGLSRARPGFVLGVGVRDPAFVGKHHETSLAELQSWVPVLRQFEPVGVRGPQSQALLAEVGLESEVLGDPALLLDPPPAPEMPLDPWLAVCVGYGDDLWGHDNRVVVDAVATTLRALAQAGWRMKMVVVNDDDATDTSACVAATDLPAGTIETTRTRTAAEFFAAIQGCSVVVAERLHAVVLAARGGIPTVALEYQPKCADFMASIEREDWTVRTDRVLAGEIYDLVLAVHADHDAQVAGTVAAVDELRGRLHRAVRRVREVTGLPVF